MFMIEKNAQYVHYASITKIYFNITNNYSNISKLYWADPAKYSIVNLNHPSEHINLKNIYYMILYYINKIQLRYQFINTI